MNSRGANENSDKNNSIVYEIMGVSKSSALMHKWEACKIIIMKLYIFFVSILSMGISKETYSQHRIDILNPLKSIESSQVKDQYVSKIYINPEVRTDYFEIHWNNLYVDKIIGYTKIDTTIFDFHESKLLPIIYNNGTLMDMSLDKFIDVKAPCKPYSTIIGNNSYNYVLSYSPCKQQFMNILTFRHSLDSELTTRENGLYINMKKSKLRLLYFMKEGEIYEFILRFNHKGKLKKKISF